MIAPLQMASPKEEGFPLRSVTIAKARVSRVDSPPLGSRYRLPTTTTTTNVNSTVQSALAELKLHFPGRHEEIDNLGVLLGVAQTGPVFVYGESATGKTSVVEGALLHGSQTNRLCKESSTRWAFPLLASTR